jgi:ABC-type lipoprotein release transport system permease subunit
MILPKLALRNLLGGGLRTVLNVIVLSFAFVALVASHGFIRGMDEQISRAMIDTEYGGGQYWHENYDPYDPLTLEDAHGRPKTPLQEMIDDGKATPILVVQGSIYPEGRIRPVLLKGIDPHQTIVAIPSHVLDVDGEELPALIGGRMAKNTGLKVGDYVTVQWRDAKGTFDARDARIVHIMKTTVQSVDNGQVWLPLAGLQEMTRMIGEATLVTLGKDMKDTPVIPGWIAKDTATLLKNIRDMIESKMIGRAIIYFILLFLAMLAIFDTQVLSIFRRRKEIGTMMALGFTRGRVIRLFTLEGALNGILAVLLGAAYGIPLLAYVTSVGFSLPESFDSYGFAMGEKLFPAYSVGMVLSTTVLVLVVTTIVSFLPTRRISKLKPTDALRGRVT